MHGALLMFIACIITDNHNIALANAQGFNYIRFALASCLPIYRKKQDAPKESQLWLLPGLLLRQRILISGLVE